MRSELGRRSAVFISSDLYRAPGFGSNHPLAIARVASVMQLCDALGWLEAAEFRLSPQATVEQLAPDQRDAVVAHVVLDRGYADIAASLRISEAVVRKRVSRGLANARRRMGARP